jgi:type IV pilus assembly protein PilP
MLALVALPWLASANAQQASPPAAVDGGASEAPATTAKPAMHRDPFRPFTLDVHPEARVQATPLQRYDLGQLTVVATMWDVNPPRAMVEDSSGMGYIVTLGTPIGPNGGVVTAIEPQRVVVEERVLDFYGKERTNRIVLETPKEEGPSQPVRERK